MQKMEELREMLCEELDKITKKGELSAGSLDVIDKLTHSIKSIDTIIAMEDAGYSSDYMRGNSYARNRRRDSMGRYSREYRDGRSYDGTMHELKENLEDMERMVSDPHAKKMIRQWMKEVEE
jgi:hypothetical protein